jgi:DNA-binding NtrC family response regulator
MKKNILILEDDEELLDIVSYCLKSKGFKTYLAKNIDELFEILKSSRIDIFFADIVIGDKKTTDYLDKILELQPKISIILTSAHRDLLEKIRFVDKKAIIFEKPYKMEEVFKEIEALSSIK